MKTRRILAASTAALLSFASVAVVASAEVSSEEVAYDKDWTDVIAEVEGTTPGVSFKIAEKDKKTLEGLTISVEAKAVTASDPAVAGDVNGSSKPLEGLKDKVAKNVAAAIGDGKAAIYDISVTPEDDEDYGARGDFALKAPIQINVTGLDFKVDHVYHFEDDKLVEIEVPKNGLTQKNYTPDGGEQTTLYGIQFSSKSFSPFVLSEGEIKGAVALDDEENPANEDPSDPSNTSGEPGANNAETGIALAIAPVVLAAGAVAVVALKKKH